MLAYTTLGASNLDAAVDFYTALTESMGWKKLMGCLLYTSDAADD